jgi:hypothetical protein
MSDDSVPDEEVRIETEVLDLRKRASRSSTEYPVFEYRIDYRGSSPGELALAESLPDGLDESDVEFHPDFHGENWSCDGERAFFEIMVPEAQVVETKFGLSVDDPAAVETVLSPPLVTVDDLNTGERIASLSADDAETVVPGDGGMAPVEPEPVSDAVRDIILGDEGAETAPDPETLTADADESEEAIVADATGDGEFVAAAPATDGDGSNGSDGSDGGDEADRTAAAPLGDPDPPDGDDLVAEAVDAVVSSAETDAEDGRLDESEGDPGEAADDRTAAASAVGSESDGDEEVDTDGDEEADTDGDAGASALAPPPGGGESVGAALAAELRAGEIPEADVELLRGRLNLTVAESDAVRLRDLQTRYHDLEAYTEALSAFVDEHGDADGVLADLQRDVERLDGELAALSAAGERLDDLERRLDERPDGDELRERVDGVVADLDAAERRLGDRVSGVEERLSTLEATVEELEDQTEVLLELQDVFGTD